MTRESAIKKSIWQFAIAAAVVLLVVVREELVGALSPRALGIVGLILWVGGFLFLTLRFRAINRNFKLADQPDLDLEDPATRRKVRRSIRTLRIGFILMPVFLIYGLSVTSGDPLFPRITGAALNLLITWSIYRALRAERAKLQQLDNHETRGLSNASQL
jgi:hypothetical protein